MTDCTWPIQMDRWNPARRGKQTNKRRFLIFCTSVRIIKQFNALFIVHPTPIIVSTMFTQVFTSAVHTTLNCFMQNDHVVQPVAHTHYLGSSPIPIPHLVWEWTTTFDHENSENAQNKRTIFLAHEQNFNQLKNHITLPRSKKDIFSWSALIRMVTDAVCRILTLNMPQQYTLPLLARAAVWLSPADTCTIFTCSILSTMPGMYSPPSSILRPRAPSSLQPQVKTWEQGEEGGREEGRRRKGRERRKEEGEGGERGRRRREERKERRRKTPTSLIKFSRWLVTISKLGWQKKSGAILWYDVLTSPSSVSATVCMPPQVTWITLLLARGPPTGNGFFLSITSSPRPSCPTSPWPSIITRGGVRCEGMGGLKRDRN